MKSCVVREASVEVVKKESQISNACIVKVNIIFQGCIILGVATVHYCLLHFLLTEVQL
jgi:hypothetical protein